MKKLKIALFTAEFAPYINGGLGRYLEYYTQYLLSDGHRLGVFTFNPGNLPEAEASDRLKIYRPLKEGGKILSYNLATCQLLKGLGKEFDFDLISVHDWMSCPVGILAALRFKVPVVFHVHNTEFSMSWWGRKTIVFKLIALCERLMAKLARQIIVPSEKMQQLLVKHGWDKSKIMVIRHGFSAHADLTSPTATQLSARRAKLKISSQTKVLLFVGRLVYAKGIFQLVEAMQEVSSVDPEVKLVVVGQGEAKTVLELQELVACLGLEEKIHLYNQFFNQAEVMEHYLLADLCVFPSLYEPFGLVALEAMAFAKPVILGFGFSEFFGGTAKQKTALLLKSEEPKEIAAAILSLLAQPEQARQMGKAAQLFVKQSFAWEETFQATVAVYERALSNY